MTVFEIIVSIELAIVLLMLYRMQMVIVVNMISRKQPQEDDADWWKRPQEEDE